MPPGRLKIYNETSGGWEYVAPGLQGATGPSGPSGPAGATGPQGATGAGDIVGPSSSRNNAVPIFNETTGKLLKQSNVDFETDGEDVSIIVGGKGNTGPGYMGLLYDRPSGGGLIFVANNREDSTSRIDLQDTGLFSVSLAEADDAILLDKETKRSTGFKYKKRIHTSTTLTTLTPYSYQDGYTITALASDLTIGSVNTSGGAYPVYDMDQYIFRIKDNGTARAITWNAIYRAIGVALPTTTTANKTLYVGAIYNSTDTKWDIIAVAQEA